MQVRELQIAGAWEITPAVHPDARGLFFEWLTQRSFAEFAGHRLEVRQANCSVSAAGVLRGLHFAQLPPSQAKYVTCVSGSVFDVVVDIRVGSPTFGRWDAVVLDDRSRTHFGRGARSRFIAKLGRSPRIHRKPTQQLKRRAPTARASVSDHGCSQGLAVGEERHRHPA